MPAPTSSPGRISELDALRGLAVIGIVWMNVYAFALPAQGYYNPNVWGPGIGQASDFDRLIWVISFVFIEDKFRTLFAMLFGAGCLMLLEKETDRPWRAHFARMAVLFAIGAAHSVLFASNDILRIYAIAGCILPFLSALSARALVAICVGLIVVHLASGMILLGGGVADFYKGRLASDAYLFADRNFGANPAAVQLMLDRGNETLGQRIERRFFSFPSQIIAISSSLPLNLSAMALGMGLWKSRMLTGEWRVFLLQRLAAICALAAIPALFWLAWWVAESDFAPPIVGAAGLIASAPFDTLLGIAYAALAMVFFKGMGAASNRLAKVGRLSLSNYLLTSVILAGIFATWGLGLFGAVSRVEALALSSIPIFAMLLWSPLWLDWAGNGPAERLWRAASTRLS